MWKRNRLHLLAVATTLSSAAFCLEPQERVIRHGTLFVGDQRNHFSSETQGADGYQADQPEAEVGYQLAELKLQQSRPSVRCDNDSMTLRMLGKRVPDILVERDGKSPVPLSKVPAHCGLTVKRARRDVFLVAKYDSCHMTQEGDNYILPLRLWGAPVKMGCPMEALFLTVSCTLSAMVIQVGSSIESLKLKVNGEWQPLAQASDACGFTLESNGCVVTAPYTSKCWKIEGGDRILPVMYSDGELTLSCPLDTTPLSAEALPPVPPIQPMDYPFPYAEHQFWPFYLGYPGIPAVKPPSAPTTTATTAVTSSTTAATTVKPSNADEYFWNPSGHARHGLFHPGYPGYSGLPPSSPTTNPTTAVTTGKPPSADEGFWNPYGHPKHWLFYPSYPGAYGYPGAPPRNPTTTVTNPNPTSVTSPTTVATTTKLPAADERFWNPYGQAKPWRFYPGNPGAPTKVPTTTATTPPTSTVKPTPSADQQQYWSPFPWLPTGYDPSVYSNAGQPYKMPWIPYLQRPSGRDQKGLLPVASASAVNGTPLVKQIYPWHEQHQDMPQPYSWPMYNSPSRQSSGIDPKLTFDQIFASRGWSSLLYPAQLSPLQIKAGPAYKGSEQVPSG